MYLLYPFALTRRYKLSAKFERDKVKVLTHGTIHIMPSVVRN